MIFYYIRHGEPTYDPDDLTALGRKQAEEVAEHLARIGVDQIFSSTSNRAIQTALPTATRLNKEITCLDFASERHVWENLTIDTPSGRDWMFHSAEMKELFHTKELVDLGLRWFDHPRFPDPRFENEMNRIQEESDRFFASLGYRRRETGKYEVVRESEERIALFAHQGFGFAFLSLLLGIPYPQFCTHFELGHAGITIIQFKNENGFSYPKVLSLSNDGHLKK